MNEYKIIGLVAFLIIIFGIFAVTFNLFFPQQEYDPFTRVHYPSYNPSFAFFGLILFFVGIVLLFYSRYKFTAQEEKKYIERAKQQPSTTASRFCQQCGSPVQPNVKFCSNCGNQL